jgi:phosphoglycolate phosphatase
MAFLDRARELGVRTGVITADDTDRATRHLALLPGDGFDVVVGADAVLRGKPHPEGVLTACSRLRVAPERTIFIGDTTSDLEAATAAGLAAGVRIGGEGSLAGGHSGTPLHLVERFDEMRLARRAG